MEPIKQTDAQKAIEDKAIAHKRGAWSEKKKAALDADLRKAVRSGLGEHFRIAYGWTERGMQSRCNKIGVDWKEFKKRQEPKEETKKANFNAKLLAAVRSGHGHKFQQENGVSDFRMAQTCNHGGIGWHQLNLTSPVRVSRRLKAAEDEAANEAFLELFSGKAKCDNCRQAMMGKDLTKAVACKDRHRPVNGSCPEYSRRLELFSESSTGSKAVMDWVKT